ncbi:NF-kappa-B essential modulator [Pelodytes ibericus]
MSVQAQIGEMVQPNEGPGIDYTPCVGGPGNSSIGMPDAWPPELANHEVFQRLLAENQDLRAALEQSNMMLRKRHSEMMALKDAQRSEHQFVASKFCEARDLVQKLTKERSSLEAQLEGARTQIKVAMAQKEGNAGGEMETERRPPVVASFADQRLQKISSGEDNTSPGSSLSSCETLTRSMCETIRKWPPDNEGPTRSKQVRQKLLTYSLVTPGSKASPTKNMPAEDGVKEARAEAETSRGRISGTEQELQKKVQEAESQNAILQQQITDLQGEISQLRQQTAEKVSEAQRQLQQLAEEKVSVKAQVTSLLGELKESQLRLEFSLQEKRKLEESVRSAREQQKEWEAQVKQHVVHLDQRRLQVQSLETALKTERQNACEEMRKLAQLQAAYHQLFQEYDTHIKKSLQTEKHSKDIEHHVQDLKQQLQEAEEALVAKQELIDKLKHDAEALRTLKDTVDVLKAQAAIYRDDFLAERQAREKLHEERDKLKEQLDELLRERAMIEEMRNRHSDNLRLSLPGPYPMTYHNPAPPAFPQEPQDFCCPKCQYKAPDMDTLQIHVMDCIQ